MKVKKAILYVSVIVLATPILIVILNIFFSFKNELSSYESISFADLPPKVQTAFLQLDESVVGESVFRCISLSKSCKTCGLHSENVFPIPKGILVLKPCDLDPYIIDFGVTSFRLFVIDSNGIFFPVVDSFGYGPSDKVSDVVNLKSVTYGKFSLQP